MLVGGLALVRAARGSVLARFGWEVIGDSADVSIAAEAAASQGVGIVLVDVDVPGGPSLAVRRIVEQCPAVSVLVVAPTLDQEVLLAALRAGAAGFVPETIGAGGLARAAEVALRGEAVVPRSAVLALIDELRGESHERAAVESAPVALTRREADVMTRRRDGMTPKEIAYELELSVVTVRRHLGSIARKARQARPLTLALESTS